MAIPWEQSPTATSVYTQKSKEEIAELHAIFEKSETAKIAANTIVEEILLSKLRYHDAKTRVPDFERETPFDLNKIIRAMVNAVLQTGYFAYVITETPADDTEPVAKHPRGPDRPTAKSPDRAKRPTAKSPDRAKRPIEPDRVKRPTEPDPTQADGTAKRPREPDRAQADDGSTGNEPADSSEKRKRPREGAIMSIEIAHPLRTFPDIAPDGTLIARDNTAHAPPGTKPTAWNAVFFRDPVFLATKKYIIPSALRAAAPTIAKLEEMIVNFSNRDKHNSAHTGFAVVNPNLATMGSGQTWFAGRDAQADSSIAPYLARKMDFKQIVEERSKTIRMLGEQTAISRQQLKQDTDPIDSPQVDHTEHIVTDGYTFRQAEALLSLGNAQHHYDRLETSILFSLGVPPQALGKNINSERLASSNTLTQASLKVFNGTVRRFKHAAQDILTRASNTKGTYIAFSTCVQAAELQDLIPYLKPDHAQHLLACAHHIPPAWFSKQNIIAAQSAGVNHTPKKPPQPTQKPDHQQAAKYQKQSA